MTTLLIEGQTYLEDLQIILFDKDGTLIDIHHYWASMIGIRASLIGERWFTDRTDREELERRLIDAMGVDLESGRMKPGGPVGVKPRPHIVTVATEVVCDAGVEVGNEDMEALFKGVDEMTARNMLPLLHMLPGVEKFLKSADGLGVDLAVVSTDITERAKRALDALGLDGYFKYVIGGDLVNQAKPSAEMVELILDEWDYAREKMVVVGDHPVDMEMGINAGIKNNVGVLTGLASKESFEVYDCTVIDDMNRMELRG